MVTYNQQRAWICKYIFVLQDDEDRIDTGEEEWMQGKTLVKPPDQLDLTEAVSKPREPKVLQY